jgi:hypothetical protein
VTARGYSDSILRVKLNDGRARFRLRMWVGGEGANVAGRGRTGIGLSIGGLLP